MNRTLRRSGPAIVIMALLTLLAATCLAQTIADLKITASPGIYPAFNPNITDYVIKAGADDSVTINVTTPAYTYVSVDGHGYATGSFTTKINSLAEGQGFTIGVYGKLNNAGCSVLTNYYVRRLPADFPSWTTERLSTPQAEFYIIAPTLRVDFGDFRHYVVVVDGYGVPIWWYKGNAIPVDAKLLPNGRIGWINFGSGEEHALDGTLTRTFAPAAPIGGGMDNHELLLLPNGNYVFIVGLWRGPIDLRPIGGQKDSNILDTIIEEVTPAGKLVWHWSSLDHIPVDETDYAWRGQFGGTNIDAYHMNSVERTDQGYVISMRHNNAIYGIDRETGQITWKLGGSRRPESLQFVGDPYSNFDGNHDARVQPDGTLTLHDNGTNRNRPPRAVRFRIDSVKRTATLLEQITDARAPYSGFTGSARRLSGGNWLMEWGGNPYMTELNAKGQLVFRLNFADPFFSYRAAPVPYGQIARAALRSGMNSQHRR